MQTNHDELFKLSSLFSDVGRMSVLKEQYFLCGDLLLFTDFSDFGG